MKYKIIWHELVEKLITNPDEALKEIDFLKNEHTELYNIYNKINSLIQQYFIRRLFFNEAISKINNQVLQFAMNNYEIKINSTEYDEFFDSLIVSLNMLGEELNYSTVTKQYITDIFNTIPEMIFVVDEQGYIKSANQQSLFALGENENTIQSYQIVNCIAEDISFSELKENQDKTKIYNFIIKDKTFIPVTIKSATFTNGKKQYVENVLIFNNVSESLEYQQILEKQNFEISLINKELEIALQKAKESDKLKSAFLANISHEIRTPMNGILGFAELLNESNITENQHNEYIQIIQKSGQRMLTIINDLIDISKIEAGMVKMKYVMTNLNNCFQEIYDFFKKEATNKKIQLYCNLPLSENQVEINTDKFKLMAIITNLVKNALKYTEEGFIEFGYTLNDHLVEIYVKDTGIGIPEARQEAIFDRFVQADIEDRRALQGAGLGLAISKSYVEMLKGNIWVKSEEGKGSTFYFTIPLLSNNDVNFSDNNLDDTIYFEKLKKINVLIVDDDETSLLLLKNILLNYSKQISCVDNGQEAINLCRIDSSYDLILMDMKMPLIDGYQATMEIRKFNKDIVIIAQTAYALEGDKERALKAGCNDFMTKPIQKNKLLTTICNCLYK